MIKLNHTDTFANSADPDETALNKPSHQDLHCLQFLTEAPICNIGCVQMQRWKSMLEISSGGWVGVWGLERVIGRWVSRVWIK